MIVINLFAGPGAGKSTTAAGVFFEMKRRGMNVELVSEYAKDMVWEGRDNVLDDQIYVFAKQNRKLLRLLKHGLDYAVTDSPLLLSAYYAKPDYYPSFKKLVRETFDSYENVNFFLQRDHDGGAPYNPVGRVQKDELEARSIDRGIFKMLSNEGIEFKHIFAKQPMAVLNLMNISDR